MTLKLGGGVKGVGVRDETSDHGLRLPALRFVSVKPLDTFKETFVTLWQQKHDIVSGDPGTTLAVFVATKTDILSPQRVFSLTKLFLCLILTRA